MILRFFKRWFSYSIDHVIDPRAFDLCKSGEIVTGWLTSNQRTGREDNVVVFYDPGERQLVFLRGPYKTGNRGHDAVGDFVWIDAALAENFPRGMEPPRPYRVAIQRYLESLPSSSAR